MGLISSGLIVPLLVGGPDSDRVFTGAYVRAASGDSFTISTPLTLVDSPRLILEKGTISLAAGKDGGSALTSLLTGGGANLILDGATLTLDRSGASAGSAGESGVGAADAMGPIVAALASRRFDVLVLRHAAIVIKTPRGAEETLLGVTAEIRSRKGSVEANGTFRLRGEEFAFDVAAAPPVKSDTPVAFRATVKGALLEAKLDGRFVRGDRLQVTSQNAELTVPGLRHAARWLGADWPEGKGLGAFEAHGPLDWSEGSLSFENARFVLDGNAATGSLSVTLAEDRPKVEGTLAFANLNLAPYIDAAASAKSPLPTDWLSFIRAPSSVAWSLIRAVDADLRISVKSVALADQTLGRCAATLSIKDGKLFADLAEIELDHGGTGDGQVGIDMTGGEPRYSVRGRLESVDVGRVVGQRLGPAALEGLGTLDVDLAGEGETGAAVLASLSGTLAVDMPEGARLGLDVEKLAAAAAAAPEPGVWTAATDRTTAVDNLVVKFAASSGVFTAEAIKADAGEKVMTAAGTVSLAERELDMTVSIAADGLAKETGSSTTVEATSTEAFRVQGPWTAPTLSPVTSPVTLPHASPATSPLPRAPGDRG